MKRAILIGAGTIAGIAAVVAYKPPAADQSAAALTDFSTVVGAKSDQSPAPSATTGTGTAAPSAAAAAAQTVDSDVVQTDFGPMQLQVTATAGKISDIQILQYPNGDRKSQQINQRALPTLIQEAVTANSANIDGVSGASYSSAGFSQALQSAIAKFQ